MFRSVCLPCRSLALFINVVSAHAHTHTERNENRPRSLQATTEASFHLAPCSPRSVLPREAITHWWLSFCCFRLGDSSEESLRRRLSALPFFNHEFPFKRQIHTRGRSPSLLLTFLRKISHLRNKSNPLNHLSSLRIPVNASAN